MTQRIFLSRLLLPLLIAGIGLAAFCLLTPSEAEGQPPGRLRPIPQPAPRGIEEPSFQPPPILQPPSVIETVQDPPVPVVRLRVRAPAKGAAGEKITYHLTVENTSQADAHHVEVHNPVPTHAAFVSADPKPEDAAPMMVWRWKTLKAGEKKNIELVVRPTGSGDVSNCARVHFAHGQCVTTQIARPQISLRKIGPTEALLHDPVDYRIEVRNSGGVDLKGVHLTDVLPEGMTVISSKPEAGDKDPGKKQLLVWNLGTLKAGEQRSFDYRTVTLKPGKFINRAVVTTAGGLKQESTSTLKVGEARASLTIDGPEERYAGLATTYELIVKNRGDMSAGNLHLKYEVPEGANVERISNSGRQQGKTITWNLGTLPPTSERRVRVQLRASNKGQVMHRAQLDGDGRINATASLATKFKGIAGLSVNVRDQDGLEVKQVGRYDITIRNTGTGDAHDVRLKAVVPGEMKITDVQGAVKNKIVGQTVIFEPITLGAGKQTECTIHVTAKKPGDVRFQIELEAKELTAGPLREQESTTIFDQEGTPNPRPGARKY